MTNDHEQSYNSIKDELIRKFRQDDRFMDWRPNAIKAVDEDPENPPSTIPILYVLNDSPLAEVSQATTMDENVAFNFMLEYIHKSRDIKIAQKKSEKIVFAIQRILTETQDDRFLVDQDGVTLADGNNAVELDEYDANSFVGPSGNAYSFIEVPVTIHTHSTY